MSLQGLEMMRLGIFRYGPKVSRLFLPIHRLQGTRMAQVQYSAVQRNLHHEKLLQAQGS